MAEEKKPHAIYGTDLSKPLPDLIEDFRHQLVQVRGQIHDVQYNVGFKEMLETASQTITCTICYLHYVKGEVEKAHQMQAERAQTDRAASDAAVLSQSR